MATQATEMSTFEQFWLALNIDLKAKGYPELTFGPAHRLWKQTASQARHDAFAFAQKAVAA